MREREKRRSEDVLKGAEEEITERNAQDNLRGVVDERERKEEREEEKIKKEGEGKKRQTER